MLIFYKKFKENGQDYDNKEYIDKIEDRINNKKIFFVINDNGEYKYISLNDTNIDCNKNISSIDNIDFFTAHFHYMIDTFFDDERDGWVNRIYHRDDGYDIPLLLEPYKGHEQYNNYIDISNIEYLNNNKLFYFYSNIKENKHINNFFNPNNI